MSSGYYLTSAFYYINLGAHMIYILRNRLEAQNIRRQKIIRILEDITNAVFKEQFVRKLLLPQDPLNLNILKDIFAKMAHCSIMKLDQASMEKMFYLMLLSVKRQIFLTSSPLELYTLTLSHMLNIVKYLQAQSIPYMEYAIREFQKTATQYSFIQYMQIREQMLSEMQRYQTKIVNFINSGAQTNNGKMVFKLRNSHNQKSIGSGVNKSDQDIEFTHLKPQNQLQYQNWITWKCNLVFDFMELYKKSSNNRNQKQSTTSQSSKQSQQKSLGDILNVKFDDLDSFEVKFDIFDKGQQSTTINDENFQQSETNSKKVSKPSKSTKPSQSFKTSIQSQFAELKFDKKQQDQEPDLLDMMDN